MTNEELILRKQAQVYIEAIAGNAQLLFHLLATTSVPIYELVSIEMQNLLKSANAVVNMCNNNVQSGAKPPESERSEHA